MENFELHSPTKYIFGQGSVDQVGTECAARGKNLLLVYGRKHLTETKHYDRITASLESAGIAWNELSGVQPNPRIALVREGIEIAKREGCDFVLGVGGGSVADTAKSIAFGAKVDWDPWDAYEDFHNIFHGNEGDWSHFITEALPFGVVTTKAGTGSDYDWTAVTTNMDSKEKLMVQYRPLAAKFCIHEPELTYTLPKDELAFGVADMMSHFFEQYFSPTPNTQVLDSLKEAFLRNIIVYGRRSLEVPGDYDAFSNLLYCQSWSCSDQTVCGTVGQWASHMIEHELTALTDLNHGNGMAIVYPAWMKYMLDRMPAKFARFAREVWDVRGQGRSDLEIGREGIQRTEDFWHSLGIKLSLTEVGFDTGLIPQAAKRAVRFGPIGFVPEHQLNEQGVLEILGLAKG
jgi:alcohol dehydrogenase YqhD (iron-dependent ADH family)